MKKWWRMFTGNHKGFSLVELICAVAILSIVITGAGSAMVISARSYQRGSSELDLQQQAQITANLLTNLIIDADTIETPPNEGDELGELSVIKEENGSFYRYTVVPNAASQLVYTRQAVTVNADGTVATSGDPETSILAEHMDAGAFRVKRVAGNNVDFTLKVLGTDGRTFESDYHVTPRNGVSAGTGSALTGTKSIWVENELVLEPNQEYDLNVRITGTSIQGYKTEDIDGAQGIPVTGNTSSETKVLFGDSNTIKIKVGKTETGSGAQGVFSFEVKPNDDSIAAITVQVFVRRVNAFKVDGDGELPGQRTSGNVNKAGGYYKVQAPILGTNLDKRLGAWYDADYVNPYAVKWSYVFTKEKEDGTIETPLYTEYVEVVTEGVERAVVNGVEQDVPYVMFKLKQDMTSGCELTVTATALHPLGKDPDDESKKTNKTGLPYGDVTGSWTLEYQAWKRNGKLDIGLGLDNSYFYDNLQEHGFMGNAQVNFWGYSASGWAAPVDTTTGFNYYNTNDTNSVIYVEIGDEQAAGLPANPNTWELVLNTHNTQSTDRLIAYSSPYYTFKGWGGEWSDISYYRVQIWYHIDQGIHAGEDITTDEIYSIEDVAIKFKNTVSADWKRTNKVYVTTSDSLENYKIYYMFDKGWEKESAYYFSDLNRFVGVVHDDGNDYNDIRCDITVSEQGNDGLVGSDYIVFSLPPDKKQECMDKAAGDHGIIREIYEYNPLLEVDKNEASGGTLNYWYISKEDQDKIKGCAGTVEFHFVEPNIIEGGAALKTKYCPTPTEFAALGNVYYVSGTDASGVSTEIKITCSGSTAIYQETSGGVTTTVNLTWDGVSEWIAN